MAVTIGGWLARFHYDVLGHLYLLTVIVLSLRVSRWPALISALVSALAWNYFFVPPRMSFVKPDLDEALLVSSYFVVALVAGQLTSHIREQQRSERQREQRATALFNLTRALAGTHTLAEGITAALRQTDMLFEARSALMLVTEEGCLAPHHGGSLELDAAALSLADEVRREQCAGGRFTEIFPDAVSLHLPLVREGQVLGVLAVCLPQRVIRINSQQRDLLEAFAAQVALLIERERLRSADERARLLAESDRLHRTLLDSVSHEMRTPLAVLRAAADNLKNDGARHRAGLPAEIVEATNRLNRLVANLLGQTRLEAGVVRPNLDWCDARDLISAARRSLGDALSGRPFKLDIPADMPLLRADAVLMEQVITNLLLNAVHYSPAGSPISILAGWNEAKAQVYLTIADEGRGIPAELRPQLFQKFCRGHRPTGNGLGLGLSIARGFMQAQGGDIAVTDHPGPGAWLTLHLPFAKHAVVPHE